MYTIDMEYGVGCVNETFNLSSCHKGQCLEVQHCGVGCLYAEVLEVGSVQEAVA